MNEFKMESKQYKVFYVFNIILLTAIGIVFLFPYLNIMAKAFNESADTALGGITIYPRKFTLENIRVVLIDPSIIRAFVISVLRVLIGTVIAVMIQFLAAYGLVKKGLRGKKGIIMFLMIPMFISGGIVPNYILYSKIGMLNNFMVYILPTAFSFYNMVVIRTYLTTIPESLKEAGRIDGAGELRIMWEIVVPLSLPIIATIALWTSVGYWNDWTTTLYYITNKKWYSLQYLLYSVIQESERIQSLMRDAIESGRDVTKIRVQTSPESLRAAQVVVTTLPILVAYPFLQKYFIKGIMIGSVKE
ncbi:MAG: carbohydrate ABC transporter permease [Clostridia bacterium]|nr:carbohydrate ABC transporter permease [Clostridia bacterium]